MLIVLITLNGNAGQCRIGLNMLRFSDEPVSGGKSALKQFFQVDLAAGRRQREKIQIVDVNVSGDMRLRMLRIENVHLIELLRPFRSVLQHSPHGRIPVDIGIFALDIVLCRIAESEILVNFHQFCIHISDAGPLRAVENIFFRRTGVTFFDENLFYRILHLFHGRFRNLLLICQISHDIR